jgi:hypothetical protein
MRLRFKFLLSVSIGLLVVVSLLAYRTLQASERIVLTAYGAGHPVVGDIVAVDLPTKPESSQVLRIDAVPGEIIRIGDRSEAVPSGYYYSKRSDGRRNWSLVPEKYILGKVEIRGHIHSNPR